MKKRWIPLILACIAAAFVFGLQMGARTEAEHQSPQDTPEHITTTIAVINADIGAYTNGIRMNYAAALIDTLDYNFTLVSPAMAQTGLQSGMYSAVVTFPSHVSTRILSFNAHQPERIELEFVISPTLSDREFLETFIAITELQLAINTTLANTYVSSILGQFHYAQDHVDSVFQNNLADLLALELLTHGDFTYNLHLDYVPLIPLNAQELDREFYMGQVASFAEEVASWYLHSYEMASNQFLWMREGLFALTENFPQQKYSWLDMLTEWTRLSEEYGELLEIYSAYVREHDLSLYEWFHENRHWNNALEDFQWHLATWHETSTQWFETWEVWHGEYLGYLDAVIEFREALETFHTSLDQSALHVVSDLDLFLGALEEYEQRLYHQFNLLVDKIIQYGTETDNVNTFLGDLQGWYENLYDHYGILRDWQETVSGRQEDMNAFRSLLVGSQDELQGIIDDFEAGVDALPGIPDAPTSVDLSHYWEMMVEPIIIPPIDDLPAFPQNKTEAFEDIDRIIPSYQSFALTMPDVSVLSMDDVPPAPSPGIMELPPTIPWTAPPVLMGDIFYDLEALGQWYIDLQIVEATIQSWESQLLDPTNELAISHVAVVEWHGDLYAAVHCPDNGWHSLLYELRSVIGGYYENMSTWHIQLSTLHNNINDAITLLNAWHIYLDAFHRAMEDFHGAMESEVYEVFHIWYGALGTIANELLEWHSSLGDFVNGTYCIDDEIFTHGLNDIYTALRGFYDELLPVTMPELPEPDEEWPELVTPEGAGAGPTQSFEPLDRLSFPEWHEDIIAPESYSGADIYEAFAIAFPLEEHAMAEPFGMAPPPQYTGTIQPDIVGDHTMITAFQPLNPLVGAPPQPDNFWHSLHFMHGQLSSFDVRDFLSDDIHSRVDRSLQSYDAFLASISDDIVHLFSDNILRMYDVNAEYNHFLQDLRWATFAAQAYEHDALQHAIDAFAEARVESSDDTQGRLGTFASMMPESRLAGSVNQEHVNFVVSPFDFVPLEMRDEAPVLIFADPSAEAFGLYQRVAVIVLVGVLVVTIVGSLIAQVAKSRKNREG